MNNIKIAKKLIKIAKMLAGFDITIKNDGDTGDYFFPSNNLIKNDIERELLNKAKAQGKKYILHHKEGRLWRIQACKNFNDVRIGEFGGLIESEDNLSHKGDCWVYDKAKVYGNACVFSNAIISDQAEVYGNAMVQGNALIDGSAKVYDDAYVSEDAHVSGNTQIGGDVWINNTK